MSCTFQAYTDIMKEYGTISDQRPAEVIRFPSNGTLFQASLKIGRRLYCKRHRILKQTIIVLGLNGLKSQLNISEKTQSQKKDANVMSLMLMSLSFSFLFTVHIKTFS